MELLIGVGVCAAILIAQGMIWLLIPVVVMSLISAGRVKAFYEENGLFSDRPYAEWVTEHSAISGIVLTVGAIIFSGAGEGWRGILSLLAAAAALVAWCFFETRNLGEKDKEWQEQCEKLVAATEKYSHYACAVSYFVKAEKEDSSSKVYIKAIIVDGQGGNNPETICLGNSPDLERFWSYAKEHSQNRVSGDKRYITINFPENYK